MHSITLHFHTDLLRKYIASSYVVKHCTKGAYLHSVTRDKGWRKYRCRSLLILMETQALLCYSCFTYVVTRASDGDDTSSAWALTAWVLRFDTQRVIMVPILEPRFALTAMRHVARTSDKNASTCSDYTNVRIRSYDCKAQERSKHFSWMKCSRGFETRLFLVFIPPLITANWTPLIKGLQNHSQPPRNYSCWI